MVSNSPDCASHYLSAYIHQFVAYICKKVNVCAAILLVLTVGFGSAHAVEGEEAQAQVPDAALQAAITAKHRTPRYTARDAARHPAETLAFFGVKPDMTVVELWPGGGWYMEILAPYLKDDGHYYAAGYHKSATSAFVQRSIKGIADKIANQPDLYGEVTVTALSGSHLVIAPAGSADMVLTFRSLHNWMEAGFAYQVFEAAFAALKPGGVFGVVEHRGDPEVWQDPLAKSGYVNEEEAIMMAEAAGFVLEASSEVNANLRDTKDYAEGVWTLPPSLRQGDKDRAKHQAIGESDRMTLKFVKPKK
jgi:predicted methyltransferase